MKVLIVEENEHRAKLWCDFLNSYGLDAQFVAEEKKAIQSITNHRFDALIINLQTKDVSVLAITDFASYRHPDIAIITVTSGRFFSDGSIFNLVPNARGCVSSDVAPDDLAAMIEHFGVSKSRPNHVGRSS